MSSKREYLIGDFNDELFKSDHVSTILNYNNKDKYYTVSAFKV